VNRALTVWAWLIVTVQVGALPEQAPVHPANAEPGDADAVSVTPVPDANVARHVTPQSIPDGLEATVPVPGPRLVTVSR
jgi:hypothetical protein